MAYPEHFIACAACDCHARAEHEHCPHCGAELRGPDGRFHRTSAAIALGLAAATVTTSQLLACSAYGVSCSYGDHCYGYSTGDSDDTAKDAGFDAGWIDFIPKVSSSSGAGGQGGAGGQAGATTGGQGGTGVGGQDGGTAGADAGGDADGGWRH